MCVYRAPFDVLGGGDAVAVRGEDREGPGDVDEVAAGVLRLVLHKVRAVVIVDGGGPQEDRALQRDGEAVPAGRDAVAVRVLRADRDRSATAPPKEMRCRSQV